MVAIKTPVVLLLPGEKRDADHAGQPWKTVCLYRTVTRRRCGSALGLPLLLLLLLADGTTCLDWGGGRDLVAGAVSTFRLVGYKRLYPAHSRDIIFCSLRMRV